MTESVKNLMDFLDRELTTEDLDSLNEEGLRKLDGLLHNWSELCKHRLSEDQDPAPR